MKRTDAGPSQARVLVVDDSPFMRKAIRRMLDEDPSLKVVGAVADGVQCMEAIRDLKPDVVTLDVMMPVMDGMTTLRLIMETEPLPVIMLSSLTAGDADLAMRALSMGAVDVVDKPRTLTNMNVFRIGPELIEKTKAAAGIPVGTLARMADTGPEPEPQAPDAALSAEQTYDVDAILIGASTGGPAALQRIVSRLPTQTDVPIAIIQHMPEGFTEALSSRLDALTRIQVKEADDGDILEGGRVVVARSGVQMHFERRKSGVVVRLDHSPPDTAHVPSIDVAMSSAAEAFGSRALGVLLTGMGSDGAEGLLRMRRAGSATIAESDASAVIFGMPRAAIERGAAAEILDIDEVCLRVAAASTRQP